ncbi:MAG: ORF6N domain-containing protein [Pseudomonadota bacterium]
MTPETIEKMIYVIRGMKVMPDADLAKLYGVETKVLNQAVKRNISRFPTDFMFQLNDEETASLRSQFVTLKRGRGKHRKYLPFVFTENGVAMLSTALNSERAIQVNIAIMRIFTKLRSFLLLEKDLEKRMDSLERGTNKVFKVVFERLDSVEERITPLIPSERKKIRL